jgi:hypothetical protein
MIILPLVLSLLACVSRYYILLGLTADHRQLHNDVYEEFDNTKRVTINREKDRQYNGTKKRDKMSNTHLQNTTQKPNDWTTRTLRKTVGEVRCSAQVSNCFSPTCNRRITALPVYGLSAIHYNITNMISFQVKLLLWVTKHGTHALCKIFRVVYGYGV